LWDVVEKVDQQDKLEASAGTMNAADFNELGDDEKAHFYQCQQCGEMVDMRQLDDVLFSRRSCPKAGYSIRRLATARRIVEQMNVLRSMHAYEIRPRKGKRGVNL
jgi:predicted RNA-binding Zn-ribbon protein involved in translation (DUF1610 family)